MTLENDFFTVAERLKELSDFSSKPVQKILGLELSESASREGDAFIQYSTPPTIQHTLFKHVDLFQTAWGAPWRGLLVLHLKRNVDVTDDSVFLHMGRANRHGGAGYGAPGLDVMIFEEYRNKNGCLLRFCKDLQPGSPISVVVVENLTGNPKT